MYIIFIANSIIILHRTLQDKKEMKCEFFRGTIRKAILGFSKYSPFYDIWKLFHCGFVFRFRKIGMYYRLRFFFTCDSCNLFYFFFLIAIIHKYKQIHIYIYIKNTYIYIYIYLYSYSCFFFLNKFFVETNLALFSSFLNENSWTYSERNTSLWNTGFSRSS